MPDQNTPSGVVYEWEIVSESTISTTATAPNLPGTGRIIGLAYDRLGNVFVKKLNRLAKSIGYTQRSPDDHYNESRTHTTATMSNLPGTGRILDKVYSRLGAIAVRRLKRLALKMGYSPDAALARIERQLTEMLNDRIEQTEPWANYRLWSESRPAMRPSEEKKLIQDCQRLLDYASSDFINNQIRALDVITELALKSWIMQDIFIELDASATLAAVVFQAQSTTEFDSSQLLNRSRKALISVSDVSANSLCQRFDIMVEAYDWKTSGIVTDALDHAKFLLTQTFGNLMNQSNSFIVLRHFTDGIQKKVNFIMANPLNIGDVLSGLYRLVSKSTGNVDWSSLDELLEQWITAWYFNYSPKIQSEAAALLEIVYRFPNELPRSASFLNIKSEQCWEYGVTPSSAYIPLFLWAAIKAKLNSADLTTVSPNTLANLVAPYQHSSLSAMWQNLLSPLSIQLMEIFTSSCPRPVTLWPVFNEHPFSEMQDIARLVPSHRMVSICKELAEGVTSTCISYRTRAMQYIRVICCINHYFRNTVATSLIEIFALNPRSAEQLFEPIDIKPPESFCKLYCHWANGLPCISETESCLRAAHYGVDLTRRSILFLDTSEIMILEMSMEFIFSSVGHYPILVGANEDGECQYLAIALHWSDGFLWTAYTTVVDGAKSVTFDSWFTNGEQVTSHYYVPVLRFEPTCYQTRKRFTGQEDSNLCMPYRWEDFKI